MIRDISFRTGVMQASQVTEKTNKKTPTQQQKNPTQKTKQQQTTTIQKTLKQQNALGFGKACVFTLVYFYNNCTPLRMILSPISRSTAFKELLCYTSCLYFQANSTESRKETPLDKKNHYYFKSELIPCILYM